MTALRLSDRLHIIASMVTPGSILADVGCDHGYLPIWLVSRGIIPKAVALDVNRGPLQRAEEHIRSCGMESRIETRLSDGLAALQPGECSTLVIAGMGGPLMERILEDGMDLLPGFIELILQPQSDIPHFRGWLYDHGLAVLDERMVKEEGKFYTIIKACDIKAYGIKACGIGTSIQCDNRIIENNSEPDIRAGVPTDTELYCGPVLLQKKDPVLFEYLLFRRRVCGEIIDSLSASGSTAAAKRRREVEKELDIIQKALQQAGWIGGEYG